MSGASDRAAMKRRLHAAMVSGAAPAQAIMVATSTDDAATSPYVAPPPALLDVATFAASYVRAPGVDPVEMFAAVAWAAWHVGRTAGLREVEAVKS